MRHNDFLFVCVCINLVNNRTENGGSEVALVVTYHDLQSIFVLFLE